ncbi:MAG: hypothetical protein JF571_09580, partial [Asticcacaulis sp.]|nr:hypothetical protein [Asticcacaulis sp.]
MKSINLRAGLLASTMICGGLVSASFGLVLLPAAAVAQDYTSGALTGTVTNAQGAPVGGATVTITSSTQGQAR